MLRLEYVGLRKRAENQVRFKAKGQKTEPADFLEFLAPGAKPVTNCSVEVESARGGKPRLELKSTTTTELIHFHQQHSGPVMAELHGKWMPWSYREMQPCGITSRNAHKNALPRIQNEEDFWAAHASQWKCSTPDLAAS